MGPDNKATDRQPTQEHKVRSAPEIEWPKAFEDQCAELSELPSQQEQSFFLGYARAANTAEDLECVRTFLEYRAKELVKLRPLPDRDEDVRRWVTTFGRSVFELEWGADRYVVLPRLAQPLTQPAAARLMPILCSQQAGCGEDAAVFLQAAQVRSDLIAKLRHVRGWWGSSADEGKAQWDKEQALAACEDEARKETDSDDQYLEWTACVDSLIPRVHRLPRGQFRLPSKGFVSTQTSGYWSSCWERLTASLESGLAIVWRGCKVQAGDRTSFVEFDRWSLLQLHGAVARQAVLLMLLADETTSSAEFAESFEVPKGMTQPDSLVDHVGGGLVHDAEELHVVLSGVLATDVKQRYYVLFERQTPRQVAADLLSDLSDAGQATCAGSVDRAKLTRLAKRFVADNATSQQPTEVIKAVSCKP